MSTVITQSPASSRCCTVQPDLDLLRLKVNFLPLTAAAIFSSPVASVPDCSSWMVAALVPRIWSVEGARESQKGKKKKKKKKKEKKREREKEPLSHTLLLFHSRLDTTHTRLPFPLLHVRVPPFVPFGNNQLVFSFFLPSFIPTEDNPFLFSLLCAIFLTLLSFGWDNSEE